MFGHPRVEPSAAGRTCATVGPLGLEPKLPLRYARLYALIGGYFWHSGPKNMDRLFGLGPFSHPCSCPAHGVHLRYWTRHCLTGATSSKPSSGISRNSPPSDCPSIAPSSMP